MNKYKNGKIYKIVSQNTDMIYIGSTISLKLKTRMKLHKYAFKTDRKIESRVMFLWDDAEIKLIENYPCESKTELTKREQYYMDLFPDYIVNKRRAYRDLNEYDRIYNQTPKRKHYNILYKKKKK